MLRSLDSLLGLSIMATDGEIGKAYNLLFDDRSWAVRYLVAETGSWFKRKKVLLSPAVLATPDWSARKIPVLLTREQVRSSPDVDADLPVSRRQEREMKQHYRWPDLIVEPAFPPYVWTEAPATAPEGDPADGASEDSGDPHLRSAKEIVMYLVEATDGPMGTVEDFIVDDEGWGILDLVVDVETPPRVHKMMVPTGWVSDVSWEERRLRLTRGKDQCAAADFLTEA